MTIKKNLKNTREVTEKKDSKSSNLNKIKQAANSGLLDDLTLSTYEEIEQKRRFPLQEKIRKFDIDKSIETENGIVMLEEIDKELEKLVKDLDVIISTLDGKDSETAEKFKKMKELTASQREMLQYKYKEQIEKYKEKIGNKETAKESTLTVTKERVKKFIGKYMDKIKEFKNANESQKEQLTKEIEAAKEELKKVKEEYENAKNNLFGKIDYQPEGLKRMPTRRIRWVKKEVEGGVVSYRLGERLQFSTIKRRMAINKLVKKFNEIGDKPIDGVRFIMGFEKARFLRYTGIKLYTKTDKIRSRLGLKMNPKTFHNRFTTGKNNIFAILDKGERTPEEQKVIDAIKERINYYGHAYAKQRSTAWTKPFVATQKKTEPEAKNTGELTDEELAKRKKEIEEELEKRNKKTK